MAAGGSGQGICLSRRGRVFMRTRLVLLSAVLLLVSAPASADSFVLRPPSSLDLDFEWNGFRFFADGFSAQQVGPQMFGLSFVDSPGCDPCGPGQTYNPGFSVANTFMGTGSATVGNTTFLG